jgi:AcrR family transcriptional regulator
MMVAMGSGSLVYARRKPEQRRARNTVDAILDAVVRILKREGVAAVTTNRIADVAGVSIGSLYQYFPDKRGIFAALHRRHVEEIDRVLHTALIENAARPLAALVRALVDAMVEAHTADLELYGLLYSEIPHRGDGTEDFAFRLHCAFRLAISSKANEIMPGRDLDTVTFVVTHIFESLSHGAVLRRPRRMSLEAAKEAAVGAIMAYLQCGQAPMHGSAAKLW